MSADWTPPAKQRHMTVVRLAAAAIDERDDLRAEVERLHEGIGLAVDLLGAAHHGETPLCDHLPWGRTGGLCVCAHLRGLLADHAEKS